MMYSCTVHVSINTITLYCTTLQFTYFPCKSFIIEISMIIQKLQRKCMHWIENITGSEFQSRAISSREVSHPVDTCSIHVFLEGSTCCTSWRTLLLAKCWTSRSITEPTSTTVPSLIPPNTVLLTVTLTSAYFLTSLDF